MEISKKYSLDNYWESNDPASVVFHTTLGHNIINDIDTLQARGLSYNYLISDGVIYELVHWSRSAWHAGVVDKMNMRSATFYQGENPNKYSVGIGFVQTFGVSHLPEKDVNAAVQLLKHIGSESGIRYNKDNSFYHKEITSYKPIQAKYYMEQVLNALIGDKDDKDAGEKSKMLLTIQYLQLQIKYLLMLLKKKI